MAALVLAAPAGGLAAQQGSEPVVSRPDRWFVSSARDQATGEPTARMLYLARDGTVLIVQCAARDGLETGGWSFMLRREDWSFPSEFLDGWWSVDDEPLRGPLRWGGAGSLVLLNEDALRDRLQQPIADRLRLRIARGAREWDLEFGVRDLASSVERFGPTCGAA